MSARKRIAISIVLLIICYFLYTRPERLQRGRTDFAIINRIDLGSNRSITILLDDTAFEIPRWYFEINVGSQVVIPTLALSRCCIPDANPKFRVVTSTDHNLVGLIWDRSPDVLLLVHDFNSGDSWPMSRGNETWQGTLQRGRKLRDRLQAENPQLSLKLSHEVP